MSASNGMLNASCWNVLIVLLILWNLLHVHWNFSIRLLVSNLCLWISGAVERQLIWLRWPHAFYTVVFHFIHFMYHANKYFSRIITFFITFNVSIRSYVLYHIRSFFWLWYSLVFTCLMEYDFDLVLHILAKRSGFWHKLDNRPIARHLPL